MKRKSGGAIWGLILILFGISIASNSLGIFNVTIFFNGWWTLFIIIPCIIGICNGDSKKKTSNIIGLIVGVFLLLSQWDLVPWSLFGPLMFAGIFITIGARLIFSDNAKKKNDARDKQAHYYQEDIWVDYSGQQDGYTENYYEQSSTNTDNSPFNNNTAYTDNDPFAGNNGYREDTINKDRNDASNAGYASENSNYDQQGNYQFYSGSNSNNANTNNANINNNANYNKGVYNNQRTKDYRNYRDGGPESGANTGASSDRIACTAIFSGKSLKYDYEAFGGGIFSVVFGGIDLDLRHAVIHNDVTIEAKVLFGGMDIILPDNARVVVDNTGIFGGVDNKKKNPPISNEYIPTIYLNVTCIFGGVDIK